MTNDTIKCPKCETVIDLTDILKKKVAAEVQQEFERKTAVAMDAVRSASRQELEAMQKELSLAQKNELELRKQKTDLDNRVKNIELEVQRKIDSERGKIAEAVARDAEDLHRVKDAEKDKKIADALRQVEEIKRKMEQGSQQLQGEILELELEEVLRLEFPWDIVEPVAKGVKGGDILQTVKSRTGEEAGKMLYELKRTKAFSEGWLTKMKSDARSAKASILILATETMPAGMVQFGMVDGVWVTPVKDCVPLARSLRFGITQVARERLMQSGKKEKAEIMYDYLIGDEFKGRIEAMVESYKTLKEDLETEKRAMEKIWARREKQINQVTFTIAGMHGEIQALAGDSLPNVKLLELDRT